MGRWKLGCLAPLLVCCSLSIDEKSIPSEPGHLASAWISAEVGGSLEIPAGQHPTLGGARIEIPPRALAVDTKVTIDAADSFIFDSARVGGAAVRFGPTETKLTVPVRIRVPSVDTFDQDRARLYTRDAKGSIAVLLPFDLLYDAGTPSVSFDIQQLGDFQSAIAAYSCQHISDCPNGDGCKQGRCPFVPGGADCPIEACGIKPEIPNWTCPDQSQGGLTGRCVREPDSSCAWEVVQCGQACDLTECGPVPAIDAGACRYACLRDTLGCAWRRTECTTPCTVDRCGPQPSTLNLLCSDGSVGGPQCAQGEDGSCGWKIVGCPCRAANGCRTDQDCAAGARCDGGACVRSMGCVFDGDCASGSCSGGVCTPLPVATTCVEDRNCGPDWLCREGICLPSNDPGVCEKPCEGVLCPAGARCDETSGLCMNESVTCGSSVCAPTEYCCNASCGLCAPRDGFCPQGLCERCGEELCPPGNSCSSNQICEPRECASESCGPPPDVGTWTCRDGVRGGVTGRCLSNSEGTCEWEIRSCPPACPVDVCGAPPEGAETGANGETIARCPDGSLIEVECRQDANGVCGWSAWSCPG